MSEWAVTRRGSAVATCLALVIGLAACGGGGGGGRCPNPADSTCPTPTPTPTATPPVVIAQGGGSIEAGVIAMAQPIVTTSSGALEVTVDWTFATNDIDVILARGSCTFDQLDNNQCNIVGTAASATAKPEKVRATGAAGMYTLFVENTGPGDDSASYQAVLFPGASSASEAAVRSLPEKLRHSRGRVTW